MRRKITIISAVLLCVLASCAVITVNIYFPEKDVREAYKALEQELMKTDEEGEGENPQSKSDGFLNFDLVAVAYADASELSDKIADTIRKMPDVVNAYKEMGERLPDVDRLRDSGKVGESNSGLLVEREGKLSAEEQKLIDEEKVQHEAIRRSEQDGIVFIDEIDKIAVERGGGGPDVSREGVQRDLLPSVEGSTITTKYGPVKTDHILFIASGAFHTVKPSDLIPELQGRFPIRVELNSLGRKEFERILTEPRNALLLQYLALLRTEGVEVVFEDDAVSEVARIAEDVNQRTENIGARRLHTLMERLLEDLLFDAPDLKDKQQVIDPRYVADKLNDIVEDEDLTRYIL